MQLNHTLLLPLLVLLLLLLLLQIMQSISETFGRRIWQKTLLVLSHGNLPLPPPGTTFGELCTSLSFLSCPWQQHCVLNICQRGLAILPVGQSVSCGTYLCFCCCLEVWLAHSGGAQPRVTILTNIHGGLQHQRVCDMARSVCSCIRRKLYKVV
jgi:hypothetical protein